MRNHFSYLAVALLTAAVGVACTGRNDGVGNPRKVQSGGDRIERVTLDGCVNEAPGGGDQFVLRNVSEPAGGDQTPVVQGQEQGQTRHTITRGSWVRLAMGNGELKKYVGKRVKVMGSIRDGGDNTIGTAGQASELPRASVANGNAPQIAVERIEEAEGSCPARPADAGQPSGSRD
jgi:hypothetical protein